MPELGKMWVALGIDASKFHSELSKATTSLHGIGGTASKVAGIATAALGTIGVVGLGALAKKAIDVGIGFNAMMEQSTIAFETMLGDVDKAHAHLANLVDFAKRTPFEQAGLIDASKRLLAFGFAAEEQIPMLTALGDAAAGLGMGTEGVNRLTIALGQMKAKTKVSAQEMMQLTEAGVPAWDILAKAIGKTTAETMKLAEKGLISADVAIQALLDGMGDRFGGLMEKQSKSFSGMMSTLKDSATIALGKITEPIFNKLKPALASLIAWMGRPEFDQFIDKIGNQLAKAIDTTARFFSETLIPVIKSIAEVVIPIGSAIKDLLAGGFEFAAKHATLLKIAVIGLVAAFTAFKIGSIVQSLVGLVAGLVASTAATGGLTVAVAALKAVLLTMGIGAIVIALGSLAYAAYKAKQGLDNMLSGQEAGTEKALTKAREQLAIGKSVFDQEIEIAGQRLANQEITQREYEEAVAGAKASLTELEKITKAHEDAYTAIHKEAAEETKAAAAFTDNYGRLQKQLGSVAYTEDQITQALEIFDRALNDTGDDSQALAAAQYFLQKSTEDVTDAWGGFIDEMKGFSESRIENELADLGREANRLAIEIVRAGGKGTDAAKKYEDELDDVNTKINLLEAQSAISFGAQKRYLDQVEKAAKDAEDAYQDILDTMRDIADYAFPGETALSDQLFMMKQQAKGLELQILEMGDSILGGVKDMDSAKEKLGELQNALKVATLRQSEYTDKTKESTRVAGAANIAKLTKDIADLQAQIAKGEIMDPAAPLKAQLEELERQMDIVRLKR